MLGRGFKESSLEALGFGEKEKEAQENKIIMDFVSQPPEFKPTYLGSKVDPFVKPCFPQVLKGDSESPSAGRLRKSIPQVLGAR